MPESPNPNLTAALSGSLRLIDENLDSPLKEATADSIDALLDHINAGLAEGLPAKISDSDLLRVVEIYRAQALRWQQDEQSKVTRVSARARKTPGQAVDLDLDL